MLDMTLVADCEAGGQVCVATATATPARATCEDG